MEVTDKKILIAGLGNTLAGDDGVGLTVLETLRLVPLSENVRLMSVGVDSLSILYELDDTDLVILIDAADWGKAPGQWFATNAHSISEKNSDKKFSLHQPSVKNLLALAKVLGKEVEFILIAVQPETIALGEGLSETMKKVIPEIISEVQNIIAQRKISIPCLKV